jgi:hypothetical protein
MARKPTIHSLTSQDLPREEHDAFFQELVSGSDRASALIGCAGVDTALVHALRCKCIWLTEEMIDDFFHGQKPVLGSLSSRTRAGLALGIFDGKFKNTLDCLRRIRNVFAHAIRPVTFASEMIVKECNKLPKLPSIPSELSTSMNAHRYEYVRSCHYARMALIKYSIDHLEESARRIPAIAGL